ncbi:hypothetical protein QJS10_CPA08g00904 [Acorus calamus]|uniref:Protein FAR1-RELATED SEQUENCE n=1 Tax=Acorus calamus TaxID=4465 RepID=A0AAV9E8L0_ACOCL|nr:hypothetical protein QJS10_CPA08g00904 [Acorus calamus]
MVSQLGFGWVRLGSCSQTMLLGVRSRPQHTPTYPHENSSKSKCIDMRRDGSPSLTAAPFPFNPTVMVMMSVDEGDTVESFEQKFEEEGVWIPDTDDNVKPKIRMSFDTVEDGEKFYTSYARVASFGVRKSTTKYRKGTEELIKREMDSKYENLCLSILARTTADGSLVNTQNQRPLHDWIRIVPEYGMDKIFKNIEAEWCKQIFHALSIEDFFTTQAYKKH